MAKTQHSKPISSSLFFCCFGSFSPDTSIESVPQSDHNPKQKRRRWFSWPMIRMNNNSALKTVPLESSVSEHKPKRRANKDHSSKPKSKSKRQKPSVKSHAPATNIPPRPSQTPPVLPVVSNQTPPQTRHGHGHRPEQIREEDTRQQSRSRASPGRTTPATASLPATKRQVRTLSSRSMQPQTTLKQSKRQENPKGCDPVVGMSVVMVTLLIMILWGRLCAILCTSAWLYTIPRFRKTVENDSKNVNSNSNDLDLDSKDYKKKVILEGLLERNQRGTP